MKKICALTMVRNDEFYLRKWVAYYGKELGMENLYVYLDGKDQEIPDWCPGVNVTQRHFGGAHKFCPCQKNKC